MSAPLSVTHMGEAGVNVDKNALQLDDNELVQGTNAKSDVLVGRSTLRKRAGLTAFNVAEITEGTVLGGSDLPNASQNENGIRNLYIGRGAA